MAALLHRIGSFSARRHWIVIIAWILTLSAVGFSAQALGDKSVSEMTIPNSPANQAFNMLTERFGGMSDASAKVIFMAPTGHNIDEYEGQIATAIAGLSAVPDVTSVANPFAQGNEAAISPKNSMAYASVSFNQSTVDNQLGAAIEKAAEANLENGLTVAYVGIPDKPTTSVTDALGLVLSFFILLITFGSLLAAGMPPLTALLGVGLSLGLITVLSNVMVLNSTTSALATMLGLAVGIDYALFIVSRHRSNLIAGIEPKQSAAIATATAGSAVVFAGVTVMIALLGLFVVGIPFLGMMGLGAAVAVLIAVAISVTLIPAVLGLLGKRLTPKEKSRAYQREAQADKPTMGSRWVGFVTAKPLVTVLITIVFLLTLAAPLPTMRLTLTDSGYSAPGSNSRTGYDALAEGWGPGTNGPLLIVADISKTDVTKLETVLSDLGGYFTDMPDVASVSAAYPNPTLDLAIVSITPRSGPSTEQTVALVQDLREKAAAFEDKYGFSYQVTGATAMGVDLSSLLAGAIVPFGVVVIGLSVILLMIVFRSLAVPITATLGYVLSLCAALGVTVAVFQWGWGSEVLSLTKVGPLFCAMPILVMAVLFGLAMDYEVFLVSRMRERYVATGDAKLAVTSGFKKAARVVTAASIIMFSVFIAFVPGGVASMQSIALALAVGVAIDALIIRMTLIPAVMSLLGDKGWALPRGIAKRIPEVDIEGEQVHGRLQTLQWQQERNPSVSIDASEVSVNGSDVAPFTFTAHAGSLVMFSGAPATDAHLALAALTGRASATGLLVSCGKPLPFDGARVRRASSLITYGASSTDGNVASMIRELLRLNHVRVRPDVEKRTVDLATEIAQAAQLAFGAIDQSRDALSLTTDEMWVIDVAVAIVSAPEVLALTMFHLAGDSLSATLEVICKRSPEETTLLCAVGTQADFTSWRDVIPVTLSAASEVKS